MDQKIRSITVVTRDDEKGYYVVGSKYYEDGKDYEITKIEDMSTEPEDANIAKDYIFEVWSGGVKVAELINCPVEVSYFLAAEPKF